MSDEIERRLRESLRRRADDVDAEANWGDLERRSDRASGSRRRLVATGVVMAMIAGPLLGFAVARATESGDGLSIAAGGRAQTAHTASPGAVCTTEGCPTEPPVQPSDGFEPLFRREANGVSIRAYSSAGEPTSDACVGPSVVAELSNAGAVMTAAAQMTIASTDAGSPLALTYRVFGDPEGSPAEVVIVHLGSPLAEQAALVKAEFANGDTDDMEPTGYGNGMAVAVLAHDVRGGPRGDGSVAVTDASGAVLTSVPLTGQSSCAEGSAPVYRWVDPPTTTVPALPPAGDQPPDEEAARQAVIDVFRIVYGRWTRVEEISPYLDDPHDPEALQALVDETNRVFPGARAGQSANVVEVRFTSPTRAVVQYDYLSGTGLRFSNRVGEVVLIDGTWKVTRVTVCNDSQELAGLPCPP